MHRGTHLYLPQHSRVELLRLIAYEQISRNYANKRGDHPPISSSLTPRAPTPLPQSLTPWVVPVCDELIQGYKRVISFFPRVEHGVQKGLEMEQGVSRTAQACAQTTHRHTHTHTVCAVRKIADISPSFSRMFPCFLLPLQLSH